MSAPRILAQVVILGSQILGKAFVQAWRQAARNAQASGGAAGAETSSAGGRGAAQDVISRTHRMTIDEAANILNVKKSALGEESELQKMLKNFDHLFAANAPLTAEGKPHSSHYVQSKIVRAKERIEAEMVKAKPQAAAGAAEAEAAAGKDASSNAGGPSQTGP